MNKTAAFWAWVITLICSCHLAEVVYTWSRLNLPEEHVPFFFTNNPDVRKQCERDETCPYKKHLGSTKCWGYEPNCAEKDRMFVPHCPGNDEGYQCKDKAEHIDTFWKEADFGYVKNIKDSIAVICKPQEQDDSALYCSKQLQHCRANNIYLNFSHFTVDDTNLNGLRHDKYQQDLLKHKDIGGHCDLLRTRIEAEKNEYDTLTTWYHEIKQFVATDFRPIKDKKCDIVLDKPTYITKPDAAVNMYHHFCDFVNLYVSQHVNNSFSTDVNILKWENSDFEYPDFFRDTYKAFTDHPILHVSDYIGKTVCFKEVIFSALPRMFFGLFYNMPLIPGCEGGSLMKAFAEHILHRLQVTPTRPHKSKIRITLLNRGTEFRNILNRDELVKALEEIDEYDVKEVTYDHRKIPFTDQLKVTQNSDIFIGLHGAGLTHLLFLPDWGVIFELYHCEDPECYSELANIRGMKYMTWENKSKLIPQDKGIKEGEETRAKFTNYSFDVKEFLRLVGKAANYVRNHKAFKQARSGAKKERDEL